MNCRDLLKLSEECRGHAQALRGAERKLLLEIADAFQDVAWSREARSLVDTIRCW
jgi:hypothetical protein